MSNTPHDALFKAIFSQPPRTAEVLRHAFPPALARTIEFASLSQEPGSFIDESMAQHHTDLLFTARAAGRDIKIYVLFEHQSALDTAMPLRLLDYMVSIWKKCLASRPRPRHLPVVLPVVLHHSDTGWSASTAFAALFGPDIPPPLLEFTPQFRFVLDDLTLLGDEVLMRRAVSATVRVALSALKHARTARDLEPFVPAWTRLAREVLAEPDGVRALRLVFRYLCQVRGPAEVPLLRQITTAADEAQMYTIADMFEAQGERKQLIRMLRHRFGELPTAALARVEAADEPLLERWSCQILDARTLDEVFAAD